MADIPGKTVLVKVEDTPGGGTYSLIAAGQSHSLTINNTEVEINTKDSGSWRDLFPEGSIKSMAISLSGVFTDTADQARLIAIAESATNPAANFKFLDGAGEELVGEFQVSSLEFGGETEGFASYSATLASNGAVTRQAVV